MQQPFSGGETLRIDERGSILPIMSVFVIVMTLLFAGLAEFGRLMILKEQTQTAVDAASLAASYSGVTRWVKISVTTDRGEEEHCTTSNGVTTCTCDPCGSTTISGIVGDERRLIDEGDWRNYCLPPCSCGGGSCWFELDDRWVSYDIQSGIWGTDWNQILKLENDLTNAVREALVWQTYPYNSITSKMLSNKDLPSIRSIISDWDRWWKFWLDEREECRYACDKCNRRHKLCETCEECESNARATFSQVNSKVGWVTTVINQIAKIKQVNQQGGLSRRDIMADETALSLFYANSPEQVEDSWVWKLMVHNNRSDPFYPSVTVYGRSIMKGLFPGLFGVFSERYSVDACGQGDTFYRDPETQKGEYTGSLNDVGKWIKGPPDACWKD